MSWSDYRDAPAPGTVLAQSSDVAEGTTLTFMHGAFPVLLARTKHGLTAFVNACPHHYLPLDYKGAKLLSVDGATLRCTNHSAGFDVVSGEGTEGLGRGCALDSIPVHEPDGQIIII